MIKAVIYARYSSNQQREESIDAQLRACRKHCADRGYTIVKEYTDEALSGRTTNNRLGYQEMSEDAKKHLFDVIVFHKIDRNSRNEYDYYSWKMEANKLGIRYEYAGQPIDTLTPEGQLMENNLVGFAAFYSRNLAKETKKGLNENAYKALFNGGTPPLGYYIDKDKHYQINHTEAPAVKLIFDEYLKGKGYGQIIDILAKKGYTTRKNLPFKKNSIFDILQNKKYIGTYVFNKKTKNSLGKKNSHPRTKNEDLIVIENAIPPIIDNVVFEKVQAKMQNRAYGEQHKYKDSSNYLLTGLLKCKECGSPMTGHTHKSRGKIYYYYTCSARERGSNCPMKMLRKEPLEEIVVSAVIENMFTDKQTSALAAAIKKARTEQEKEHNQNVVSALQKEEARLMRALDRYYNMLESGIVLDAYDEKRFSQIKANLTTITDQIAKEKHLISSLNDLSFEKIQKSIENFRVIIEKQKDSQLVRAFLNTVVQQITFADNKIVIDMGINVVSTMVPRKESIPYRQQPIFHFVIQREYKKIAN